MLQSRRSWIAQGFPPLLFKGLLFLLVVSLAPLRPATALASSPTKEPRYLEIITSFPPEFYAPFIAAFSKRYPQIQVLTLNKKTTTAIDEIKRGNLRHFDLFWSSSPDAFAILKSEGALTAMPHGRHHKAIAIDGVNIDDPDGFFRGFALSGVGWMWNPDYLKKEGMAIPRRWESLGEPAYYGHLAMSTPSRSGTTHLVVESLLQEFGWERGWALLLRMAGNLKTISARSFSVPEGLIHGRFGVGLGIDFLALSRPKLAFRYGAPVYLAPASIALLKGGPHPTEAALFVDFILSPEGQSLLLAPAVSRVPVSEDFIRSQGPEKEPELLGLIRQDLARPFDVALSQGRYHLVNQLFDRMITHRLPERRKLWKRFLDLEKQAASMGINPWPTKGAFLDLLTTVPVSADESKNPLFTTPFTLSRRGASLGEAHRKQIQQWDRFLATRLRQAKTLLDGAEFDLNATRH